MMSNRRKWDQYILFFAFVVTILLYGLLVHLVAASQHVRHSPDPAAMRPIVYGLAGLALVAAMGLSFLKMPHASTPAQFKSSMVLALSVAGACSIFGMLLFFLGGPSGEFPRFQIATIAVDILCILPQIVRRQE